MKPSILRTLATLSLGAALGSASLCAQTRGPIRVTVPFNFTAGSTPLPAGAYSVWQAAPDVLAIQSVNGTSKAIIMGDPAEASRTPGDANLTFNKYGERYFLSQVSGGVRGWKLRRSSVEREKLSRTAQGQPIVVAASE